MESISFFKDIKISPKKLRFFLEEVKKFTPNEALDYLIYLPNKAAREFHKTIKSALNNAKNKLQTEEKNLRFKHLSIEQGHRLKRYKAGARGTAKPILRRMAHIKIILVVDEKTKTKILNSKPLPADRQGETLNKSKIAKSKLQNAKKSEIQSTKAKILSKTKSVKSK